METGWLEKLLEWDPTFTALGGLVLLIVLVEAVRRLVIAIWGKNKAEDQ